MVSLSGRKLAARANDGERMALARRFGLERIEKFEITGRITPINPKTYGMLLTLNVNYTTLCVASLSPLDLTLDHQFEITASTVNAESQDDPRFLPRGRHFDMADRDNQFAIIGGEVDIAECAVQLFAGELDPYPRAPDTRGELPDVAQSAVARDSSDNPFNMLRKLKEGR
jgi:hypothetical protein